MKAWLEDLYRLKRLPRTGWLSLGIAHPESVADHSFATALIAWRLARREGLDGERVLLMALFHDFHEARLGDIPSPEKEARGKESVQEAERETEASQWGEDDRMPALLEELRLGTSPEARLVRAVDGLELGLQARLYREEGFEGTAPFIRSMEEAGVLDIPAVGKLWKEVEGEKKPPPSGEVDS